MTLHRTGRRISFLTLTAPGQGAHSRWGLKGRSTGVPCSCHDAAAGGIAAWNVTAGHRWHVLATALRREYPGLEYLRVVEPQGRGAIHLHVMLATWGRVDPDAVQALAVRQGFGCVMDLEALDAPVGDDDSIRRTSSYLAKYVTKSADGRRQVAWERLNAVTGELVSADASYRTWSASRGWGVQMGTVVAAIRDSARAAAARRAAEPSPPLVSLSGQDTLALSTSGASPPGGG